MVASRTTKATTRRRAPRRPAHERREAILQAATRVFAEASYRSAGTVEIAREAGVGEPTLYRYFTDKRALYLEVLRRSGDHILEEWNRVARTHTQPLEAISAIGAWYLENVREEPEPLRVRARAVADSQEEDTRAIVRDAYLHVFQFVRELFAAARDQGLIDRQVDLDAAAWLFMGVGQVIDLVSLLDMEERLDGPVFGGIQQLFRRALAPEGETAAGRD